jgi:hypothetical protein
MTELNEIIAPPEPHTGEDKECPFCPEEPPPEYETFPGVRNNSDTLAKNMEDPDGFGKEREKKARPKLGEKHQQNPPSNKDELKEPHPIHTHSTDPTIGDYSCEAHHLISGKQALAKKIHNFERWICEGNTIEKDTGYSVNNPDNGIWLPSIPENYKPEKGKNKPLWGPLDYNKEKQVIAEHVMEATQMQFHKSHHRIKDEGEDQMHLTYDDFLIGMLKQMDDRMVLWSNECPFCKDGDKPKEKFQPSVRANQALDNLSRVTKRHITGPRQTWDIFISKLARDYHKPVCPHTKRS